MFLHSLLTGDFLFHSAVLAISSWTSCILFKQSKLSSSRNVVSFINIFTNFTNCFPVLKTSNRHRYYTDSLQNLTCTNWFHVNYETSFYIILITLDSSFLTIMVSQNNPVQRFIILQSQTGKFTGTNFIHPSIPPTLRQQPGIKPVTSNSENRCSITLFAEVQTTALPDQRLPAKP